MLKNRAVLLVTLPLLVVALSACSSGGPGASPATESESQLVADAKAWDVAHAQCLRVEGIDIDEDAFHSRTPEASDQDVPEDVLEDCEAFARSSSTAG
jgi:hypothetical protein